MLQVLNENMQVTKRDLVPRPKALLLPRKPHTAIAHKAAHDPALLLLEGAVSTCRFLCSGRLEPQGRASSEDYF